MRVVQYGAADAFPADPEPPGLSYPRLRYLTPDRILPGGARAVISIRKKTVLIVTLLLTLSASASQGEEATTKSVDFSRDIRSKSRFEG